MATILRSTRPFPRFVVPALSRTLRRSAPVLSEVIKRSAPIDPQKYFDGESLPAHQQRVRHADPGNRTFNYAMVGGARFIAAASWRLVLIKFLAQMNPSADVMAMSMLEVDISKLTTGDCMTVKWRGKPVFIRARSDDEIDAANAVDMGELRDPESDADRVQKAETLVVLGVCTHLGCVPINNAGDYAGWFCPCHGSHYDTSGRIRKGPAPLNLEVPPYSFLEDTKLMIG
uniref:Cytochrome b-c1 complex subunit Rieske, mitochondrial n=1 Tax=Coccolithus braarudii TaxID=221442 RepID=A0A7S0PXE6_9EUKA|mmetsp:Transcript_19007/g.40944  ORF Transcript_19007/g.40944 Transcript_19007/m.40944 type:complete len:230 (+) Transcript_19007:36-725(+)